jgi:hypothetical protein
MPKRQTYSIETLSYSTTRMVWRGGRKVAMLFPPLEPGGCYQLYPHPDTFPTLNFEGLPAPLRPEFMSFASLDAVCAFLGIKTKFEEPQALALAS